MWPFGAGVNGNFDRRIEHEMVMRLPFMRALTKLALWQ
jgi:hypothetical protein